MHRRIHLPECQPHATRFSQDRDLSGTLNIVRALKQQRWVWRPLSASLSLNVNWGRPRKPGKWELVAVAFVASQAVDLQPWHDDSSDELWRECGFNTKPNYRRVWRRLRELEDHPEPWIDAVTRLIQQARRHDSRVCAHLHFDSTEDETHASPVHDCAEGDACAVRHLPVGARGRRPPGSGIRPQRVSTATARADRQAENEEPAPENDQLPNQPTDAHEVERNGRTYRRFRMDNCWWITRDLDAGIRAYMGPRGARRFWHGYYNQKGVCHFTGGVAVQHVFSASVMEYNGFVGRGTTHGTYDLACRVLGGPPDTAVGDKGFSIKRCFEACTRNGTAPIFPWRPKQGSRVRHDHERWDRHGVLRCKHCGGETEFVRFNAKDRRPRLWAMCIEQPTAACRKEQSISCSKDFTLLLPLWRTSNLYQELRSSHDHYEAAHDWHRDRYKVAADQLANRPKICSMAWHQLLAHVACLIDWLRICYRHAWLGSARVRRRNHRPAERTYRRHGYAALDGLMRRRASEGLCDAYGAKAVELGLADDPAPPSRR